ncbi:MAG TPA: hypothetical protein VFM18_16025, partial [Methanosarcina sp.]|nr:hypothetical protein [Methanosarcina sp.]
PSEVGKNKAEVLADRYRKAFGANIDAVPLFIPSCDQLENVTRPINTAPSIEAETEEFMKKFLSSYLSMDKKGYVLKEFSAASRESCYTEMEKHQKKGTTIVISCVDSPDARRRLLQLIPTMLNIGLSSISIFKPYHMQNFMVIDAGNEDAFGQVSYFHPLVTTLCDNSELLKEVPDRSPCSLDIGYVPMPIGKYLNMKEGVREGSCADLDQTLAINQMMATFIGMIFQNLLYGMKMDFHTLRANLNGTFSSDKMSLTWMKGVVSDSPDYLYGAAEATYLSEEHKGIVYSKNSSWYSKFIYGGTVAGENDHRLKTTTPVGTTGSVPQKIVSGTAPLEFFYKSHYAFSNWKDIVWPTIYENVKSGFLKLSSTILKELFFEGTYTMGTGIHTLKAGIEADGDKMEILADKHFPYNACVDICKAGSVEDTLTVLSRIGYNGLALPFNKGKLVAGKSVMVATGGTGGAMEDYQYTSSGIVMYPHRIVIRSLLEDALSSLGKEAVLVAAINSKLGNFEIPYKWIGPVRTPYLNSTITRLLAVPEVVGGTPAARTFGTFHSDYYGEDFYKVFHSSGKLAKNIEQADLVDEAYLGKKEKAA